MAYKIGDTSHFAKWDEPPSSTHHASKEANMRFLLKGQWNPCLLPQLGHGQKTNGLILSMKYWLFNRDPYGILNIVCCIPHVTGSLFIPFFILNN